jgi:hypothetical protein
MNELFQGDVDLMGPTKNFCENCIIEDVLSRVTSLPLTIVVAKLTHYIVHFLHLAQNPIITIS